MASGILLQFRRAPLHVLGNLLYSAFFVAWLVYRVLLGFSSVFLRGFFSKSVALAVSLRFILYKGGLSVSTRYLVSVRTRFFFSLALCWRVLLFIHCSAHMAHPRSTYKSLSAGVIPSTCTSSPPSSAASVVVSAASVGISSSFSNDIASAIAQAFSNSLPTIIAAIRDNAAPVSSAPSVVLSNVCSAPATVVAGSIAVSSGTWTLPSFVSTFPCVSATTGSNSARPVLSFASPLTATHVASSSSSFGSLLFPSSVDKAFVVGPGHAPIPAKLVAKITSGQFVDLADLFSANLRTAEHQPQTFLDAKLVVSKKRRVVEIQDILTWTEAFTIFQMVMCATHSHRWPDLTKYKLLIIQTARQSTSRAWMEYDLAFRKDAAATGASDWSKMNLDLYNFHLRSPAPIANPQSSTSPPVTVSASRGYISQPPHLLEQWAMPLALRGMPLPPHLQFM